MTAFDNIKTNNWPTTSNNFEDFLVFKTALNDNASLTESLSVGVGSKELFPKRTLTNSGVFTEYARIQPNYGATGFTKSTNWRTDYDNPEVGIFNGDGTSTQAAIEGDNAEHWFAFATPLTNVTKVETRMGHDGNQSARAYMGNGTTNYVSTAAHATYFTVYSGAATTFSKIGWRSNNGSGASVYDIRITDDTGTYVLVNNENAQKHYGNNSDFSAGHLDIENSLFTQDPSLTFGSGDFTMEAWVYISDTTASNPIFCGQADGTSTPGSAYIFTADTTNGRTSRIHVGSSVHSVTWGQDFTADRWYHLAFVRDGGTLRTYIDGVQGGSTSLGTNAAAAHNTGSTTNKPCVGSMVFAGTRYTFQGKIQDLRVYKGVCKYPDGTTFTPPSAILG